MLAPSVTSLGFRVPAGDGVRRTCYRGVVLTARCGRLMLGRILLAAATGYLAVAGCSTPNEKRLDSAPDEPDVESEFAQDAHENDVCLHLPDGAACEDGDLCTGGDSCQGSTCESGPPVSCDSGPCEDAQCDSGTGCYTLPAPDGSPCSMPCFGSASCAAGACEPEPDTAIVCPPSSSGCVVSFECSPETGECDKALAEPQGEPCNSDADLCTVEECDGQGHCAQTTSLVACEEQSLADPCWTWACNAAKGCLKTLFLKGGSCDDGNACTVNDSCVALPSPGCTGTLVAVDDGNPCTDDACHDGSVTHTPVTGPSCGEGYVCLEGGCVEAPCDGVCPTCTECSKGECVPQAAGMACTDDDACTALDSCAGASCIGEPVVCADGNSCTDDGCQSETGCVYEPNTKACDDANACTGPDVCFGGQCIGEMAVDCGPLGLCQVSNLCDPLTGSCVVEAKPDGISCSDDNPCSEADTCAGAECVGTTLADGTPCSDGNPCTVNDHCNSSMCSGEQKSCPPASQCHLAGQCDAMSGVCSTPEKAPGVGCDDGDLCTEVDACSDGDCLGTGNPCADGNPCTQDACGIGGSCDNGAEPNGSGCDDGDACSTGDQCANGVCKGTTPVDCDDANPCTTDSCVSAEGCAHGVMTGLACDDGDACTSEDNCTAAAQCAGQNDWAAQCNDGNGCTDDTCVSTSGCVNAPNAAVCNDGDACTNDDHCGGGTCLGWPQPLSACDDANSCTDDTCLPSSGCVHQPNNTSCNDGVPCTNSDKCSNGACKGTPNHASCEDGNPCTTNVCSAATGCSSSFNSASCNDGDLCTVGNNCVGGNCGQPKVCNDGVSCTTDQCVNGGCVFTPVASGPEVCDGKDNDCDSTIDEGCDQDGDGWCAPGVQVKPGALCQPTDCCDSDPDIYPSVFPAVVEETHSTGFVGPASSVAVEPDGTTWVAVNSSGDLLLKKRGPGGWSSGGTIDSPGYGGVMLRAGNGGALHVLYTTGASSALKYGIRQGASWNITSIESAKSVSDGQSWARSGNPLVVHGTTVHMAYWTTDFPGPKAFYVKGKWGSWDKSQLSGSLASVVMDANASGKVAVGAVEVNDWSDSFDDYPVLRVKSGSTWQNIDLSEPCGLNCKQVEIEDVAIAPGGTVYAAIGSLFTQELEGDYIGKVVGGALTQFVGVGGYGIRLAADSDGGVHYAHYVHHWEESKTAVIYGENSSGIFQTTELMKGGGVSAKGLDLWVSGCGAAHMSAVFRYGKVTTGCP